MAANGTKLNEPTDPGKAVDTRTTISDHVLLRRVASGSYGEVWIARCALGSFRAVKLVYQRTFTDPRPYEREFAGIKRYEPISREHEGLVDILQVGRNDEAGFFYYVMELADDATEPSDGAVEAGSARTAAGPQHSSDPTPLHPEAYVPRTLAQGIRARGRLTWEQVLTMSIALAEGLQYLHSKGLVHRDLKPSNIIFVGAQPKLADVGLVAELGDPHSRVGTEGFMAPEGPGTAQADIYSLGKVMYEALTGKDRQEFPELPTHLGSTDDASKLLELNEVILKACEREPDDRYESAARLLADLKILQCGQSLRRARVRRQKLRYAFLGVATILAAAALTGLIQGLRRAAAVSPSPSKPEVLFAGHFQSATMDTQSWAWSHKEWPGLHNTGHSRFRTEQADNQLAIEAEAQHDGGWTIVQAAWVDTKADLRKSAGCRVDLELSGSVQRGRFILSVSDGKAPVDRDDSDSVPLVALRGEKNEPTPWIHQRVRIDLLPTYRAAVVYPDALIQEQFEIVDLARLDTWRLRLYAAASSSTGFDRGVTRFKIKKVLVTKEDDPKTIIGHVTDEITASPVPDTIIRDETGARLAKTLPNGAFKLSAAAEPLRVWAEHSDFAPSEQKMILGNASARAPVNISLRKRKFSFGDVVDTLPCSNNPPVRSIGFQGERLLLLVAKQAEDLLTQKQEEFQLLHLDINTRTLSPAVDRIPVAHLASFATCEDRLVGVTVWPGSAYDLSEDPPAKILDLAVPVDGSRIRCTADAAFDGEYLWFVEADGPNGRFGLYAVDVQRRSLIRRLPSRDNYACGLAWDGRQFWIASKGRVYAVNRDAALRGGAVEAGIGREFPGTYTRLAWGAGHLWGLESDSNRICKIKMTD